MFGNKILKTQLPGENSWTRSDRILGTCYSDDSKKLMANHSFLSTKNNIIIDSINYIWKVLSCHRFVTFFVRRFTANFDQIVERIKTRSLCLSPSLFPE